MQYLALFAALSGLASSVWIGLNRMIVIIELLVQIREQGKNNDIAIKALEIYDSDINRRVHSLENYLEKTTDFSTR